MYSKSFLPAVLAMLAMLTATSACDAGSTLVKGVCTFCPVGTYALAAATQCTKCPASFWAPVNSVSKDACYPIALGPLPANGKCDAGSAPKDGVCAFCVVGTYALAGAAKCTSCPKGWWAPSNSVSKDACYPIAGQIDGCDAGSAPNQGFCVFCPVGTYALAGASQCTHCAIGYWAPINSVSKDACYLLPDPNHCDAGSAPVNGVCTFCPVGSYALASATQCTACAKGYTAPINSVSKDACYPLPNPDRCDAGSAPVKGICTFCPVGTYALASAKSCSKCPAGWWSPINSVSKDACYPLPTVAADEAPADAATALRGFAVHCDAGSAPIKGKCTFCPVGTYAMAGASQCIHCAIGYWAPINSVSKDACYPL